MKVPFSYLQDQFSDPEPILADIKALVQSGDFTLGYPLEEFEKNIAKLTGAKYAVGVNSGTDALFLSLKASGIGPGDEVITCANTFFATAGAIVAAGAKPVFVDVDDTFTMDPDKIEAAITGKTKAIMPVHYMGLPAQMPRISAIAKKHTLTIVEDSCQALGAAIDNQHVGTFGAAGGFSFHPLKNLNVWADSGIIITQSDAVYQQLLLLRNHGLINRDEMVQFGYNSRMDSVQAVVGNHVVRGFDDINKNKHRNAALYNKALRELSPHITLPRVADGYTHSYHLYIVLAQDRDTLLAHLQENDIEAKIHYPIPLHLQKPCRELGYKEGDFPVYEEQTSQYLTLPVHQHLHTDQIDYVIDVIAGFYKK